MGWQDKFKMIASVYLLLIDDQERVLLLRRQNTGYKDGELGLPAGHVDGGESLRVAACREAKEEAGLELDPANLELVHTMHRHCGDHERMDFFFTCRVWDGEPVNTEPEKCSELVWAPMKQLPDDVIDYYNVMFEHVSAGNVHSDLGWDEQWTY